MYNATTYQYQTQDNTKSSANEHNYNIYILNFVDS